MTATLTAAPVIDTTPAAPPHGDDLLATAYDLLATHGINDDVDYLPGGSAVEAYTAGGHISTILYFDGTAEVVEHGRVTKHFTWSDAAADAEQRVFDPGAADDRLGRR